MTGFGVGEAPLGGGRIVVEARSVNHRFVEVRVNLPPELSTHAYLLEQHVRTRIARGRFDITARVMGSALPPAELDADRARAAFEALAQLRDEVAPSAELPLSILAAVPDLFRVPELPATEPIRVALTAALDAALDALDLLRQREGAALARDLTTHITDARQIAAAIAQRTANVAKGYRERLRERVARLLSGTDVEPDPGRLEMELAMLADRSDVSEELARLGSHLDQLEGLLDVDQPIGRTMEFLLQELAREANTVASKSPDAALTQRAVDLKAAVERMREQVQNIE